jgi:predicted restriction endonuclease
MPAQLRERKLSRTAWVLGFNTEGQVVHNLQDPTGLYEPVTSVTETNGRLYFGSIDTTAVGGQPAFRQALLDAYSGRCAISGWPLADVLEAADIVAV